MPAVTHDYLPTIMEAIGATSDNPTFPLDGVYLGGTVCIRRVMTL